MLQRSSALAVRSLSVARRQRRCLTYKAPLRDLKFILEELHNYPEHYQKLGSADMSGEMIESINAEAAKFAETELMPLYLSGNEGCKLDDKGNVVTPAGFKEAYASFIAGGWQGLSVHEKYGGQGLPTSMGLMRNEMIGTANWPWSMYPGLSIGAIETITLHGSEALKDRYLPPMASGVWSGTMCLTEAQAGTDLNQVKTRAVDQNDGTYRITGEKIFISCGDNDMTENVIHIVLARLPGAPPGTRGISLFLVPKYVTKPDGTLDNSKRNITIGSIEHKMGIHGSATCVVVFDNAVGYLIGTVNKGLPHMFTFMNFARLGTALQALSTMELALQNSVPYCKERMSMRSLSGAKFPDRPGDPIICQPDVRRMLLLQKSFSEGGRAMIYGIGKMADLMINSSDEQVRARYEDIMGLYTPILKGFLTELSIETAYYGQQVYGGHGFIVANGMEQIARDARISTLYEGTTGIQALDLIGRKVLTTKPPLKLLKIYCTEINAFCLQHATDSKMRQFVWPLFKLNAQWFLLAGRIALVAMNDKEQVGASAYDFLMYSGYVMMAYHWAQMALIAQRKLPNAKGQDKDFYLAKLQTAQFYFEYPLHRAAAHRKGATTGSESFLRMDQEHIILPQQ